MAMAVVFAMLSSYILSRTLVPVLVQMLLKTEHAAHEDTEKATTQNWFSRIHTRFNEGYEKIQARYTGWLNSYLLAPKQAFILSAAVMVTPFLLLPFLGRDFFPSVDAG